MQTFAPEFCIWFGSYKAEGASPPACACACLRRAMRAREKNDCLLLRRVNKREEIDTEVVKNRKWNRGEDENDEIKKNNPHLNKRTYTYE